MSNDIMVRRFCLKGLIGPLDYLKWKIHKRNTSISSPITSKKFTLQSYSDYECKLNFRFTKRQILRLAVALMIPETCVTIQGVKFGGIEGLCIMLRRLCYPNRLFDLVKQFKRDKPSISRISNWMTRFIATNHGHLLSSFDHKWMRGESLERLSQAIVNAGCPYKNIVGFIDGTARPICRPSQNQQLQYSGYKKCHVIKYQSIVTPNGLIARLDGPINGHRHDSAILYISKLLDECRHKLVVSQDRYFAFYGDPGYANQKFIKVGYKNRQKMTERQKTFNAEMSALRVHVEYGFGKILQLFAFLDFKKNQKLLLQPVKLQYIVATLLANCHTCLNGSQVSDYFSCSPPTLEEYLC